jgi:hypothetical protein
MHSTRSAAMIADLSVWRAAALLIDQHSGGAEIFAAQHADQMLSRGDLYGQKVWMRIRQAVLELRGSR